jgi:hypothetical protein
MRSEEEITRAHDLLVGAITGDCGVKIPPDSEQIVAHWASVLCWVLHHDHNTAFPENLQNLEKALNEAGIELGPPEEPSHN